MERSVESYKTRFNPLVTLPVTTIAADGLAAVPLLLSRCHGSIYLMSGEIISNEPALGDASEHRTTLTRLSIGYWIREMLRIDRVSWLALIDQGIVSGISLVVSVIVGRLCGAEGLGMYALGMSIFVLFTGLQSALISSPYTVLRTRREDDEAEKRFAGSSLVGLGLVSLLAILLLGVVYSFFRLVPAIPDFDSVVLAVMLLIPFLMMRDFVRRYVYSYYLLGTAVAINFAVFAIQLVSLLILAWFGKLTPISAFGCLALGCGVSAFVWLIRNRTRFEIDLSVVKAHLLEQWVLGRWVLVELLLATVGVYLVHWMITLLMDSTATGVFAACLVVVNLSSPFLQGMGNILSPKFATVAAKDSVDLIHGVLLQSVLTMMGVMLIFTLGCILFGESILEFLYPETEYAGHGWIIVLLAVRGLIGSATISMRHALIAMHQPRASFACTVVAVMTTFVLGLILIPELGIMGGAIAMVFGAVSEVIVNCYAYLSVVRRVAIDATEGGMKSDE